MDKLQEKPQLEEPVKADVVDLKNDIPQAIEELCLSRGIDISRITQGQYNSCLIDINNRYIKDIYIPRLWYKDNTIIDVIEMLCDVYIYTCFRYNKRMDIYGFSLFSGIDDDTLYNWLYDKKASPRQKEIIKNIIKADEEFLTGNTADGFKNPIGSIFLLKNRHGYTDTKVIERHDERQVDNLDMIAEKMGVNLLSG